jgi:tetratricopeptide (TPR) repeat protein
MSTTTIKRFLMLLSSARNLEREQLYQLIEKAEYCYCLKNEKGKFEFGKALSLFASPFDLIGDYYQSYYLYKTGQKNVAREKLQRVLDEGGQAYKDKALLTLGAIEHGEQNIDEAIKLRFAASKSEFLPIHVEAAIGIASIFGSQGEHDKAIEHLERVLPLLSKLGNVPLPFDVLNSYATELAEIGKLELASEVITPVIVSPFTSSYRNWIETAREIGEKSSRKTMMTVNKSNVIAFPIRELQEPQEAEKIEAETKEPRYPHATYISDIFDIREKVEDWVYGSMKPDDFTRLMLAIAESEDYIERDMIIEEAIDSTFPLTPEGMEAKQRWREGLIAKMQDEMRPPESD